MSTRQLTKILAPLAGVALLAGCGGTAQSSEPQAAEPGERPSPPSTDEEVFLEVLDEEGIGLGDDELAIEIGHLVCDALDAGSSFIDVSMAAVDAGYTEYEAGFITGASIGVFCPEHEGELS